MTSNHNAVWERHYQRLSRYRERYVPDCGSYPASAKQLKYIHKDVKGWQPEAYCVVYRLSLYKDKPGVVKCHRQHAMWLLKSRVLTLEILHKTNESKCKCKEVEDGLALNKASKT